MAVDTTPLQDPEPTTDGCCGCKSKDADVPKELFPDGDESKHPVLDNTSRKDYTLCCCLGTDWPSLIVFMCVVAACFGLWIAAFFKGQVEIAIYGMNWAGNICGVGVTANAPYQVWINPTVTSSIFRTAVCMPTCPIVNTTGNLATNDTATVEVLESAVESMSAGTQKTDAEAALTTVDDRITDLKSEVQYMEAQLGNTAAELDRSTMYCLCNQKAYPTFLAYSDGTHNIAALCADSPANVNGYITLPYDDSLAQFVGKGENLAVDTDAMNKIPCAFRYRTSQAFTRCMPWVSANSLGRITLVHGASGVSDGVSSMYNAASQKIVSVSTDINKSADLVMTACAIALVMSIFLIYFMSCTCYGDACQLLWWIVWGVLITLLVVLSGLTALMVHEFKFYKDRYDTVPELVTRSEDEVSMYIYGVGMALAGLATFCHFIFIMPCVCGDQINNAIQIIAAASEVFDKAWGLLFYPLIHNVALIVAIVCWLIGLMFIATAGTIVTDADGVHTLAYDENFQSAFVFYFVCIVWIVEFMGAVGFMIVAAAILIDFFDNKQDADPENPRERKSPLWEGAKLVLSNHLGTAAIGSFFITLVVVIRALVTYLLEYSQQNDESEVFKYIAACVQCCCECIETCIRYMVGTAYILTVLEGRWFFSAVCGGLSTLLSNMGQVMATQYIAFVVLWICKLAVPLASTTFAYFMLQSGHFGVHVLDLSSSFNVLVPIFVISCLFSFTFMGLLGTSIEVCLIAFLKCEEMAANHPDFDVMSCIPKNCAQQFENFTEAKAGKNSTASKEAELAAAAEGQPLLGEGSKEQV